MRVCQICSFPMPAGTGSCPKCDSDVGQQSDGSVVTIDIAHRRETVAIATQKLERAVAEHRRGLTFALRVVVGRGKIGQDIKPTLNRMKAAGEIRSFKVEENNPGALIIQLKKRPTRKH